MSTSSIARRFLSREPHAKTLLEAMRAAGAETAGIAIVAVDAKGDNYVIFAVGEGFGEEAVLGAIKQTVNGSVDRHLAQIAKAKEQPQ